MTSPAYVAIATLFDYCDALILCDLTSQGFARKELGAIVLKGSYDGIPFCVQPDKPLSRMGAGSEYPAI
jgi:hypothetical protein